MLLDINFPNDNTRNAYSNDDLSLLRGLKELFELTTPRLDKKQRFKLKLDYFKKKNRYQASEEEVSNYILCLEKSNIIDPDTDPIGTKEYNYAVKAHYIRSITEPYKYGSRAYNGFVCEKGTFIFRELTEKYSDKLLPLERAIFEVNEFLKANEHYLSKDFSKEAIDFLTIIKIIHVEELTKFYNYLLQLKNDNGQQYDILDVVREGNQLIWKGNPALLAFLINLLEAKGYISGLSPYGERKAALLLRLFKIEGHKTTKESLGKCFQLLNNDQLPINSQDASKFQRIPHRNELKK